MEANTLFSVNTRIKRTVKGTSADALWESAGSQINLQKGLVNVLLSCSRLVEMHFSEPFHQSPPLCSRVHFGGLLEDTSRPSGETARPAHFMLLQTPFFLS